MHPNKSSSVSISLSLFACLICQIGLGQSLVSIDDAIFGPDSITLDTNTGLEWLDLTFTANISTNDLVTETMPGGEFETFEIASLDLVLDLFSSVGLEPGFHPSGSREFEIAEDLANLFGPSSQINDFPAIRGNTSTPNASGNLVRRVDLNVVGVNSVPNYFFSDTGGSNPDLPFAEIGTFLFRPSAIPEPNLGCVLIALGIGIVSRRRL